MRSLLEDDPQVFATKLICLVLGVGFLAGGIGLVVGGFAGRGALLMGLGAYVTAASLVGLRQGPPAWNVFAPAGIVALSGLLAVSAGGALASA
jgi:hypothetical protein